VFYLGCQNNGNLNMKVMSISARYNEDVEGVAICTTPEDIAPGGQCTTCEASYTVTQDDLDRGSVKAYVVLSVEAPWEYNAGNTDWKDPPQYTPAADTSDEVPADQAPFVSIEQTADPDALTLGERWSQYVAAGSSSAGKAG
jgi:hypothetical protein